MKENGAFELFALWQELNGDEFFSAATYSRKICDFVFLMPVISCWADDDGAN